MRVHVALALSLLVSCGKNQTGENGAAFQYDRESHQSQLVHLVDDLSASDSVYAADAIELRQFLDFADSVDLIDPCWRRFQSTYSGANPVLIIELPSPESDSYRLLCIAERHDSLFAFDASKRVGADSVFCRSPKVQFEQRVLKEQIHRIKQNLSSRDFFNRSFSLYDLPAFVSIYSTRDSLKLIVPEFLHASYDTTNASHELTRLAMRVFRQ